MPNPKAPSGTQVVSRIALLLRLVGRTPDGARLPELVEESGLTRPTAHRLLVSLAAEGLLEHEASAGRWRLGPEAFIWGAVAASRFPLEDLVRPHLRSLAEATGESAFFSVRRGGETVCLMREEGSFPIRSFVLSEGVRFPLGVASAGLAILAFLEEPEQQPIVDDDAARVARYGAAHAARPLRTLLGEIVRSGYAVNPGLVLEGSWGMGAAVFDDRGRPAGALSLTGIEPRFSGDRRAFLGERLLSEAHSLSLRLQQHGW